jgi:hypothetical protein
MRSPFVTTLLGASLVVAAACDPGTEEVDEVHFPRDPAGVSPAPPAEDHRIDPVPIDTVRDDPLDPERIRPDTVPPAPTAPDTL